MNRSQHTPTIPRKIFARAGLFICCAISLGNSARSDSIYFGVASACTAEAFTLVGLVEANGVVSYAGTAVDALKPLAIGEHQLSCNIKGTALVAELRVFGGESGRCMGAGYVDIPRFEVGALPVDAKKRSEAFNWSCPDKPMLVRLRVHADEQGLVVERCMSAEWSWEAGYAPLKCSSQPIAQSPRP